MKDDLNENRSRPYYWDSILDLDEKFQEIRLNSERFFYCHNENSILEYEGEYGIDSINRLVLNGYGAVYHNGIMSKQGIFVNGVLEGDNCVEYAEDGHMTSWGAYKNGLRNGYAIEFDNVQDIVRKGTYHNGVLHGEDCEVFHNYGNIKYKGSMKNGVYQGQGSFYYKNSILKYSGTFFDGLIEGDNCTIYQKDTGSIRYIGQVSKGLYDGYGSLYKEGEKDPIMKGFFFEGTIKTGTIRTFYKNGNEEYVGDIHLGKYEGRGKMYHTSGKLVYEGTFVNEKEQGREVVIYDEFGNISLICGMKNGEAFGYMEAFDKDMQKCYYHGDFDEQARITVLKDNYADRIEDYIIHKDHCKPKCEIF